jgi:hypothetical protein
MRKVIRKRRVNRSRYKLQIKKMTVTVVNKGGRKGRKMRVVRMLIYSQMLEVGKVPQISSKKTRKDLKHLERRELKSKRRSLDAQSFVFSVTSTPVKLLFLTNLERLMSKLVKLVVSHSKLVQLISPQPILKSI